MTGSQSQGVAAVGFLIMAFTDEKAGDEALKAMKKAKLQNTFYFEDAVVIRQDKKGKVHYQETGDMRTGRGAGAGALIGGILGILGGPAGIALGAGAGAAIGAAASHGDAGFRDKSLETIGVAMKPGTSAVAAITSRAFLKTVQQQVGDTDVRPFVSNLAKEISSKLEAGKNVALGIILSEKGLAFKEVAANEESLEVVGAAITDEAVIAGAAIATSEGAAYKVGAVTEEGAFLEAGVITEGGAVIVDDIETDEGETILGTAIFPEGEEPPEEVL